MGAKEFLVKNSRLLQSLAALFTILLILFGVVKFFFSISDVEVTVSFGEADLPTSISNKYSKSIFPVVEILKNENKLDLMNEIINVDNFLSKTKNKAKYEIINNSDRTLKNLDIRIKNVIELTAWGVTGNILQSVESQEIMRKMKNDEATGIVTFTGIEKLPPQTNLIINIWGDVREFSLDDPILVTYDGGVSTILRTSIVKGFDSFIYENSEFLVVLLIIVNIGIFLAIVDGFHKKYKKNSN